jgi:hypothetical protein
MCATSRIKDGDWVVVDGTAGTVELETGRPDGADPSVASAPSG